MILKQLQSDWDNTLNSVEAVSQYYSNSQSRQILERSATLRPSHQPLREHSSFRSYSSFILSRTSREIPADQKWVIEPSEVNMKSVSS